jgi:chromosome segregation ATPase
MQLLTREKLEKMSEDELEQLYQEEKRQYDRTLSKNRRIHEMLKKKVDYRQDKVILLKREIEELLTSNPEIKMWFNAISEAKDSIDNNELNPEKIQSEIESHKDTLSNMQTSQTQIQREINEIKILLEQHKTTENQLQKEIGDLVAKKTSTSSNDVVQTELLELSNLTQEYQALQNELDYITKEINSLKAQIQR